MRKLSLVCLLVCLSFKLQAQTVQNPCEIAFTVDVVEKVSSRPNEPNAATVNWDFSAFPAGSDIKLEIMPIRDCWRELEGKQFGTVELIKPDAAKGSKELTLLGMRAKCFKWRTIINTTDCNQTTDWKYYSFLPKQ